MMGVKCFVAGCEEDAIDMVRYTAIEAAPICRTHIENWRVSETRAEGNRLAAEGYRPIWMFGVWASNGGDSTPPPLEALPGPPGAQDPTE